MLSSRSKMVKVVVGLMGSAPHINSTAISTVAGVEQFLDKCRKYDVKELDTAGAYVNSERLLGEAGGPKSFIVSTKAPAFAPKSLAYDKIIANCAKSLEDLKTDKVDIYYIHGPDSETPIEEQCDAIGRLYKEGKFARFGVSNISPDKVRAMHKYCAEKGYCLPKVYQVGYNPVQRGPEDGLFPTLRELGMNVYCYSPLAGGLFAKGIEEILAPGESDRYKVFPIFQRYLTDESIAGMRKLTSECDKEGITLLEATLRWFKHHSPLGDGDGFILGASKIEQLDGTLPHTKKGPLSDNLVEAFDELWQQTKPKSAPYYFD